MSDEAELIAATLEGDAGAFGALVREHQDRLFHSMVHVLGCREDAADVCQDAFVQAFSKLATFQGNSAFYTWLYRIALNLAASFRRKRRPTSGHDMDGSGLDAIDHAVGPASTAEQEETVHEVRTAVAQLPLDHRTVIVLREFEGSSYEEMAELLEIPVGTVRSRLARARMALRESLSISVVHGDA